MAPLLATTRPTSASTSAMGPRAHRRALAARADHSEYLVWDRTQLRAEADASSTVVGHLCEGEIVACVQRVGLAPSCWMYVRRLRRLPPRATRGGWVQESARPGLRALDKLSNKERTTPAVLGDPKQLREGSSHDRSWHAVEARIAALEADALHRGGGRGAARKPAQKRAGAGAMAAAQSLSLHRVNAQRQTERASIQQRQRLASGALAITAGRCPPSAHFWRHHSPSLNDGAALSPDPTLAVLQSASKDLGAQTPFPSSPSASAKTMAAANVPPMLQRLIQASARLGTTNEASLALLRRGAGARPSGAGPMGERGGERGERGERGGGADGQPTLYWPVEVVADVGCAPPIDGGEEDSDR
jgi:hypothetical protein